MLQLRTHVVTLHLRCHDGDASTGALPVDGEVRCEDGTIRSFTGWIGLVNELERVVAGGDATRPA